MTGRTPLGLNLWAARTLAAGVWLGLLAAAACDADDRPVDSSQWINVRDCGASGSSYETTAATTAGSKQIKAAKVGDFQVGQGVTVSRCNIRYTPFQLWGTGIPYMNSKPANNSVEVRGYDGTAGSWLVFVLDIEAAGQPAFRWTDDLGGTWHPKTPITHDWQPLSGGVEVKLNQRDWESGYVIAFGARDQLVTTIEKIEGDVLTLKDAANRTVKDALVRHCDDQALRAAVDRAIREKRNVYVPNGHYRLAHGIRVSRPQAITIEGASAVDTLLDISDGEGSCFSLAGGTEVTLRNFRMVGFMGFDQAARAGCMATRGSRYIWGFGLKHCCAVGINGTERVLVENCHASRMSGECFVSGGPSRGTVKPGQSYSGHTYLRCSVTDSARNAFNDVMCGTENTSVLQCRIVNVGGCSWEGASRFVKFIGNYVRNAGTVAMGNLGPANRDHTYPELGAGQHIIADNVFESGCSYGGRRAGNGICTAVGSTQVIIRNNIFVNYLSPAVVASGNTDTLHYPSANTLIAGNIFDMTCVEPKSLSRTAIDVSANDTIVSDNQVYVRGPCDPLVTGIRLREPALNVNVHDNLLRNCGQGIFTSRGDGRVAEVVDAQTFTRTESPAGLPLDRVRPGLCRGWTLVWLDNKQAGERSVIESFDPQSLRFKLREPRPMKTGDRFQVIPTSANWLVHDNTLTGCLRPLVLDSHGSQTAIFRNNLIARGSAEAKQAIESHGLFRLIDNQVSGFDEAKKALGPKP